MSRPLPPHGHSNRYAYGCRCKPCTKAASRADLERRLDRMAGRSRKVPAGPAREHVQKLLKQGLSKAQIDRASGVPVTTVQRLVRGQVNIKRENAEKILRVPLNVRVTQGDVSACGATRRVRALYALGHFNREIALVAGVSRDAVCYLASGKWSTLEVSADDGIRAAYDRLSMRAGESWKTRKLAERHGWAPPLAWDDDTIDDPAAVPQTDVAPAGYTEGENVVARFLMGESVVLDKTGRREAIAHLMEWTQDTPEEIGARLDMTGESVSRAWERIKRKARDEGRKAPWRRVYVPLRDMNLNRDDMRSAA
ncbi:helix-turn-helix transcriptional regulator [Streptomyces sp. NPDC088135]|uniref:helix-turn-helix domain-containing protein n=1 Tax=Streptomyces sp. NPDC088135 TaxID=3160993 RepID=UPI00342D5338